MKRLLTLVLLACGLTTNLWASSIPGALSGRFTINASGDKIVFSQGNLQYVGTWQFAEHQWDCFSASQYNDHRDLFGWGTGDAPNKVSTNNGDYGTFTDWGTNAITNGGNKANVWRTLTKDEWVYLFYSRENAATLFGFGSVAGVNGLIILPDNWTTPEGASFSASTTLGLTDQGSYYHNGNNNNYTHNTYTAEQWAVMESSGAVFLPAAAYRHGADSNIQYTELGGFYWSSTPYSADKSYYLNFYSNDLDPQFNEMRYGGRPVRLVKASLDQDNEGYYLLGSLQDWRDFATLVQTTPTANAKMTADIDLGNDQTHIGSMTQEVGPFYSGTFDGQGHTLTIAYDDRTGNKIVAPFTQIRNATIKNLKVAGSIYSTFAFIGVVGYVNGGGNSYISNVWSSASFTCAHSGWNHTSGIVGSVGNSATANISDCVVTGSVSGGSYSGTFIGCTYGGTAYTSNCLSTGTLSVSDYTLGTTTNCYIKGYSAEVTDDNLSNGTITAYLQNNRAETVWVQDPLTNQPMLALFAGKYKVPASGLGTFSAKAKFNVSEGLEAYYCKNYDSTEGTISVEAINGVVPAETGVLLRGTPGVTYTLTATNAAAATVTDNALVAVTEQTTIQQVDGSYTNFGLSGGVFKKVNSAGGTVKANRAYLHILTSALTSEAISLVWDEEITSVNDIRSKSDDERGDYYNLNGQRVAHPAKGLYIVNGKKVIIK